MYGRVLWHDGSTPVAIPRRRRSELRRELSEERWNQQLWQCQQSRRRHPDYRELWPRLADFHEHWPLLAHELIHGAEMVRNAAAGRVLGPVPYGLLDPPYRPREPWSAVYAEDLARRPRLWFDLAGKNPIGTVLRRAALTPAETDVARPWLEGVSLTSIARLTGKQKRTVSVRLERIRGKLETVGLSAEVQRVA